MPLALLLGTLILIAVYMTVNLAYLYVFPLNELANVPGDRIASALMTRICGSWGGRAVALLILFSAFDVLNAGVLTNARVYYAMANEGVFPSGIGKVHPRFGTPVMALWLQCFWTLTLLISGSYDLVTSMYVWVNWLFYFLMAYAVFVFRKKKYKRAFSMPGYPYIPALFACFTVLYLMITLYSDILSFRAGSTPCIKSLMGLVLVLTGTPLYFIQFYYIKRKLTK